MTVVQKALTDEGYDLTVYFRNPNIHPWMEMGRRLQAVEEYASELDLPLETDTDYPLESYLSMLLEAPDRCRACFAERLSATARRASELGIGCFSTTLSVSPYQDQEALIEAGRSAAERFGVSFLYMDLRGLYRDSVRISRELGMYRQSYCGCIFSERDRYCGS